MTSRLLFELPHHPTDFNLWAGNSFERCGLGYRRRIGRALTLDLGGGGNDIGWTDCIADAPTRHRVSF